MGAQQSSGAAGAAGGADAGAIKTSYYELLDVERTATDDEIKKAYRKKALELHPDRNYGDVERTTALFADVQTAYQVLSDPHERAWYDAHEGDILRGGDGQGGDDAAHYEHNMRVTTADELARMMGKFRAGIDYSDAPSGFYGFVRDAFDQLAREEQHAADFSGAHIPDYPSFGHKDDTYDDVVRSFYAAWAGFATVKSFSWMDRYRPSDAPDRRVRRAIDKENKKFRDEGIREFNDAVRTLVAFVRKRDPRYTPNTQSPEEAAKAQREASKAKAAKARAANAAKWQEQEDAVPEWARAREADEEDEESEEEEEEEHFECVACRKTFKSERQYDAHEKSKKHQKAVYALRKKMQKDNAELDLDGSGAGSGALTPVSIDGELEVDDLADKVHNVDMAASESDPDAEEHAARDEDPTAPPPRKPHAAPNTRSSPQREHNSDDNSDDAESESDENDEYAARSAVEARFASSLSPDPAANTTTNSEPSAKSPPSKKLGAAAIKRAKRAAKLQAEDASASASATDDVELAHKCAKCEERFASKTKLFRHIKERGHVALVSEVKTQSSGAGGGGRKKKKR